MVKAKAEVTLKFHECPHVKTLGDKVAISLECGGRIISATLKAKSWHKALVAMQQYPEWVAGLSGKLGRDTARGFELVEAGLQVFERKPKSTSEPSPETIAQVAPAVPVERIKLPDKPTLTLRS